MSLRHYCRSPDPSVPPPDVPHGGEDGRRKRRGLTHVRVSVCVNPSEGLSRTPRSDWTLPEVRTLGGNEERVPGTQDTVRLTRGREGTRSFRDRHNTPEPNPWVSMEGRHC